MLIHHPPPRLHVLQRSIIISHRLYHDSERCLLYLLLGKSGSGKSGAVRKLVVDWAQGPGSADSAEDHQILKDFDFVFLIQLKNVDDNDPLEKIIIQQHGLDATETEIEYVLEKSSKKSLLIFDGYDEYQAYTNYAIDEKITGRKGNPFVLVTSRPDRMNKKFKHKMEEIQLQGLDEDGVKKCTKRYLDRDQGSRKSSKFQKKAKDQGIAELLKVPILLLMLCVLFVENGTLPTSKTNIIQELIEIYIMRAEEKGEEFGDKKQMLRDLGELSYRSSQRKTQRMFIKKVDFKQSVTYLSRIFLFGLI